jgi:HK97 family phage prohead protease
METILKDCKVMSAIDDVDMSEGIVTAYVSVFDEIDSDGDIILQGAYKKTIKENANRVAHLLQHNVGRIIGRPISMEEDKKGLLVRSKISKTASDVLTLYREGIYKEHSVGFIIPKGKSEQKNDARLIQEIILYEYSTVVWGAQPLALVQSVKSNEQEYLSFLYAALRVGSLSDDTLDQLEKAIKKAKKSKPQEPHFESDLLNQLKTIEQKWNNLKF